MKQTRVFRKIRILIGLGAFIGLGLSCASTFHSMRPLRQGEHVALFSLSATKYPDSKVFRKQLPKMVKMPTLGHGEVKAVLGNLVFRRKSFWGVREQRVFYKDELEEAANLMVPAIKKLKAGERLVVVTRFDPDKSVLSRMERVTFLIWADASGLNVLLGEIRNSISSNDFEEDDDWMEILPIPMAQSYPYYSLVPSRYFSLKKINNYTHNTWAVYRLDTLSLLRYYPDSEKKVPHRAVMERRREILRSAYRQGLLTRKEYEEKLKQINKGIKPISERVHILEQALKEGLISKGEFEEKMEILEEEARKTGKKLRPNAGDKKSENYFKPKQKEPAKDVPASDKKPADASEKKMTPMKKEETGKTEPVKKGTRDQDLPDKTSGDGSDKKTP